MSERDMVMTYETLFEISRLEKTRDDLQKLDSGFFKDVLAYLRDKKNTFEKKESQELLFERDEKETARMELENVKKILKDIYDRREKKIIHLALNKSKSGLSLVNIGAMLPSEQALFHTINSTLGDFREKTLFRLVSGELPHPRDAPDMKELNNINNNEKTEHLTSEESDGQVHGSFNQPSISQTSENTVKDASKQPEAMPEEAKELKTTHFLSETAESFKKVRFLAAIDEIIGPDLQIYGPFDSGAISELPKDLAAVLIEKEQAKPA